jgi:hypothetical protein
MDVNTLVCGKMANSMDEGSTSLQTGREEKESGLKAKEQGGLMRKRTEITRTHLKEAERINSTLDCLINYIYK